MEVREFQKLVAEFVKRWEKKRGTQPSERDIFIHLVEEVGELARQYVNEKERSSRYDVNEVENAICDILAHTIRLADLHNFDIEAVMKKIIEKEMPQLD